MYYAYIMLNKSRGGYPGADCESDHIPIVANMKVNLRTLQKTKKTMRNLDLLRTDK